MWNDFETSLDTKFGIFDGLVYNDYNCLNYLLVSNDPLSFQTM